MTKDINKMLEELIQRVSKCHCKSFDDLMKCALDNHCRCGVIPLHGLDYGRIGEQILDKYYSDFNFFLNCTVTPVFIVFEMEKVSGIFAHCGKEIYLIITHSSDLYRCKKIKYFFNDLLNISPEGEITYGIPSDWYKRED